MKRALVLVVALFFAMFTAFAETMDLSSLTDAELDSLEQAIALERETRAAMRDGEPSDQEDSETETWQVLQKSNVYDENTHLLQQKLKDLGFLNGRVDGYFGNQTEKALIEMQAAMGLEQTGTVNSPDELNELLDASIGEGFNLVWDGRFEDVENRWESWGSPTLCEIVELEGQNWMHLISSGVHWEGLSQPAKKRTDDSATAELKAGQRYTLSFLAFAAEAYVGAPFNVGIHNNSLADSSIQEQYWTPVYTLSAEPVRYVFHFTSSKDGTFRLMIGNGQEGVIEAFFSDVKVEEGDIATVWTPAP